MASTSRRKKREAFKKAKDILLNAIKKKQDATVVPKIRIPTPNIPPIPISRVSMDSKLPGETRTNRNEWPGTTQYVPIGNNVVGEGLAETMKMAINEGLKQKNQVRCSCGPGVDCSKNSACHCNQMAKSMASELTNKLRLWYRKSVPVIDADNAFWKDIFFNCGDHCSCSSCKMNALRDMKEENFKVLRTDGRGFCVYSKHAIKQGHPVVSFNGEIVGYDTVNSSDLVLQYALRSIDDDKVLAQWVKKGPGLTDSYKSLLQKAFMKDAYINPLYKGNCSRFLSHSCKPNVSMRRIFQGGLSPANMRIVMFADRDILPGEEVTFDYGELYKKTHLTDCLCTHCNQMKKEKQKLRQMRSSRSVDSTQSSSSSGSVIPPTTRNRKVRFNPDSIKREAPSQERDTPGTASQNVFKHIFVKQEIVSDDEDDVQMVVAQPSRQRQGSVHATGRPRRIKKEEPDDYEEYEPPTRRFSSRQLENAEKLSSPVASTHGMTLRRQRQPSIQTHNVARVVMSVPPHVTAHSGSVGGRRQVQEDPQHRSRRNSAANRYSPFPQRVRNSSQSRSVPRSDRVLRSQSQETC